MGTFGQVLEQQGAVVPQHVGLQRQQAALTHERCAQAGHRTGLVQRLVLLGGQGWAQAAGLSQKALVHLGVQLGSLPSAVGAAGLGDSQVCTCGGEKCTSEDTDSPRLLVDTMASSREGSNLPKTVGHEMLTQSQRPGHLPKALQWPGGPCHPSCPPSPATPGQLHTATAQASGRSLPRAPTPDKDSDLSRLSTAAGLHLREEAAPAHTIARAAAGTLRRSRVSLALGTGSEVHACGATALPCPSDAQATKDALDLTKITASYASLSALKK